MEGATIDDDDLAEGEAEPVGLSQQALGAVENYYTVNSNRGSNIQTSNPNRRLKSVRLWAMSQHAGSGSNAWACTLNGGGDTAYCVPNVSWSSGSVYLKIDQCFTTPASNGSLSYECRMCQRNAGGPAGCSDVGFAKFNSAASATTTRYYFNDGGQGEASHTTPRFSYVAP